MTKFWPVGCDLEGCVEGLFVGLLSSGLGVHVSTAGRMGAVYFKWQSNKTERIWDFDAMECHDRL